MGGFNAGGDQIVQELVGALPATTKNPTVNAGLWTTPTYWQGKIYIWGRTDVLKVFQLSNGLLQTTPIATGTLTSNGSNLLISADSFNNNAILWALQLSGTGALQAYDANNISTQLYSSTAAGKRDAIVIPNFAVPIVANGRIYVGGKNALYVFGPLP
jgi:hypothetical protein